MICGQDNFAGEKVFEKVQDKEDLRLRHFASEKDFECFQDIADLDLRQFFRGKIL